MKLFKNTHELNSCYVIQFNLFVSNTMPTMIIGTSMPSLYTTEVFNGRNSQKITSISGKRNHCFTFSVKNTIFLYSQLIVYDFINTLVDGKLKKIDK